MVLGGIVYIGGDSSCGMVLFRDESFCNTCLLSFLAVMFGLIYLAEPPNAIEKNWAWKAPISAND